METPLSTNTSHVALNSDGKGGLSSFVFLLRKLSAPVFGYALRVSVATVVGAHLLRAV